MNGRNEPCWCGSGKKWKKCHFPKVSPNASFSEQKALYKKQYQILLKTDVEIEGIRKSCQLAKKILKKVCEKAVPGVTTEELNTYAHKLHLDAGAIPAPLGYGHPPFPKSICTSLNDVICHGIPDNTVLQAGDILNVDVTCILNGYYGDCSQMVVVGGKTSHERQTVVDTSFECLMRSIEKVRPGLRIFEIGNCITTIAEEKGCSVVYQFVGHGVGVGFHEAPQVPHSRNKIDIPLAAGMTFTIEPMINFGRAHAVIDPQDKWTARTPDGQPSAQWEHTLLVTPTGCEILTL